MTKKLEEDRTVLSRIERVGRSEVMTPVLFPGEEDTNTSISTLLPNLL